MERFRKITMWIRMGLFTVIAITAVVYSYNNAIPKPNIISEVRLDKTAFCLTHVDSIGDGPRDIPPYGQMVYIDKNNCTLSSLYSKGKALQIFGGYCSGLEVFWENPKLAKIKCATSSAAPPFAIKKEEYEDIQIVVEVVPPKVELKVNMDND